MNQRKLLKNTSAKSLRPLERVMKAAARLIIGLQSHNHKTEVMSNLHWLPLTFRIKYKLCLMMHAAVNGHCPIYISELVRPVVISWDVPDYATQQHFNMKLHAQEPNSASKQTQSWCLSIVTNFRFKCDNAAEWLFSNDYLKLITLILL
jgi:hypothetical protein